MRGCIQFALVLSFALVAHGQAQQWSAQRIAQIGDDQGITFGLITGMAVAPDGRFFVLDGMESRIHVFSAAGKLERSFGRRGAGPGELGKMTPRCCSRRAS